MPPRYQIEEPSTYYDATLDLFSRELNLLREYLTCQPPEPPQPTPNDALNDLLDEYDYNNMRASWEALYKSFKKKRVRHKAIKSGCMETE